MILKYQIAKTICAFLPPIMAQSVRNAIISVEDGERLNLEFQKKSFTGHTFNGNTSDFHAFNFSIHGYFDWRNVVIADSVLKHKKGGSIIEVGANIGTETISFCDIAKKHQSQVYAFEPLPSNIEVLTRNIKANKIDNLSLYNYLVSNASGVANFNVPSGNNSGSGFIATKDSHINTQSFEVVTLDETIVDDGISLICIDVEGLEFQVLQGSEGLIARNKPVLILEVNKRYLEKRGHIKFNEFCSYISGLGYTCYAIDKLGMSKVDFNNHKVRANKNWVCIPSEEDKFAKKLHHRLVRYALYPFMKLH